MTIQQQVRLITQILQEDGVGDNDERFIQEKIKLLESIIQDPAKYKEFDHLSSYARYLELLKVAEQINYEDTMIIKDWKIPIEKKLEECQERLEQVAPATLEEAFKKEKRNLYVGIIGRDAAAKIQGKGLTLDSEIEELRNAAEKINPSAIYKIDQWDLSEEQRDYIFVQRVINQILNGNAQDVELSDIEKLQEIRDKIENSDSKVKDTHMKSEMRKLLKSSSMNFVFEMVERKKREEGIQNAEKNENENVAELGEK